MHILVGHVYEGYSKSRTIAWKLGKKGQKVGGGEGESFEACESGTS